MQVGRWILEAFVFTAGVLLGGQIGVGTILFVLLTGPVLARTIPPTARFMGTTVLDVPHDLDV